MKVRAMLIQQGLAEALNKDDPTVVLDERAKAKRADVLAKAHSVVVLSLGDKVLREVARETTALGIFEKCEELYMTKSLANRLFMKQRLYAYRFSEDRNVLEQLEDFSKAIDDLENIDVKIDDEDKAILLLNALPKSYDQIRDVILFGREGTVTLLQVQSALRSKELQRTGGKTTEIASESLNIKKFKGKKVFKKDKEFHKSGILEQKETRACHWCKKPGHLKKDCFAWKRKQAQEGTNPTPSSDCIEEQETTHALNVMEKLCGEKWILDSGCSLHMCPYLELFEEISEAHGSVVLGNNQVCQIKGIGRIRFRLDDDSTVTLSEVRYIPEVKRNLISLGVLERKGCSFHSADGSMEIRKGGAVIIRGRRSGSLYYLCGAAIKVRNLLNAVKTESMELWHMRLGHPADGSIKELIKKEVISGTEERIGQPCEECILGKAKKLPYQKGKHTSTAPLAYVHSDLWGPSPVVSIGGEDTT